MKKLELTWVGKEERARLEPRILVEDPERSYTAAERVSEGDIFDNRLIFGDNLLALKALEQEFAGKVKCIFIDPPFNTGSAFEHYEDGVEHSLWLTLMRDRLELLHKLLALDGLAFFQIDYREGARLKMLLDEVFGPQCFKNEIIVRRGTKNVQSQFETIDALATGHDSIYLYGKSVATRLPKLQALDAESEPGKWDTFWRGTDRPTMRYELFGITPDRGQWRWSEGRADGARRNYERYVEEHSQALSLDEYYGLAKQETGADLDFVRLGPEGTVQYYVSPRNYRILSDVWMDVRTSGKQTDFSHEKHEELIERILRWASQAGDLILDSFAGSGSTGAAAHKMGRRWIMVELGEHCHTHIIPRMQKVIDGTDQGGISKAVGWKGGGGFRYYRLADTLLKRDKYGRLVINEEYNAEMLAEAMCKHMGFVYQPSQEQYWIHGRRPDSDERSFLYVTTQHVSAEAMAHLSEEVGDDRHLVVTCCSFDGDAVKQFKNLEVLKIPQVILSKCEFGEEYEARIAKLGWRAPEPEPESAKVGKARAAGQGSLLDEEDTPPVAETRTPNPSPSGAGGGGS